MIAPSGCFTYTVILQGSPGRWHGLAQPASDPARHPGVVGDQPQLELVDGTLTLKCSESWISRKRNRHYSEWGPPASEVRLAVGGVVEAVARHGDVLTVYRTGTGDCGVELRTGGELKTSLGAVRGDEAIRIEEDPRAHETRLYGVAAILDADDTSLVWVGGSDPPHESVIRRIQGLPAGRWVIAIAGQDPEARRRMNHRISAIRLPPEGGARWYVDVDERFTSRDKWLSYLRSLPKRRPNDLWIRFTAGNVSITLKEGDYGFMDPWHLFVQRVFTPGLPGELSQLAIVRSHPTVNKEMVIESAQTIASRPMEIRS